MFWFGEYGTIFYVTVALIKRSCLRRQKNEGLRINRSHFNIWHNLIRFHVEFPTALPKKSIFFPTNERMQMKRQEKIFLVHN
jgi:hypothetical protein